MINNTGNSSTTQRIVPISKPLSDINMILEFHHPPYTFRNDVFDNVYYETFQYTNPEYGVCDISFISDYYYEPCINYDTDNIDGIHVNINVGTENKRSLTHYYNMLLIIQGLANSVFVECTKMTYTKSDKVCLHHHLIQLAKRNDIVKQWSVLSNYQISMC